MNEILKAIDRASAFLWSQGAYGHKGRDLIPALGARAVNIARQGLAMAKTQMARSCDRAIRLTCQMFRVRSVPAGSKMDRGWNNFDR
jgi:stage V sporulation protein SpoVS